ncbi:MAG: peptidyl-alpha-hydroxyglycine alpha-amidating lyase family protein [Gammaproteobacteria bacterium]|nr:peptidyl-alpha-hydroxyglycine alpha-amidating lyase family protein [Gammaproteobacteria bacterium]MDP2346607.1 peptidyl-alpha-hydroxyglycine alpha-amidating lyase family protein [Gammaproteobacteria bacterium]
MKKQQHCAYRYFLPLILIASLSVEAQQNTELPNIPNSYRTYEDVVTMPEGRVMGSGNAVDVDSQGNIWVFERCGRNTCLGSDLDPILKFSPEGDLLTSFGAGMFVFPHGIVVDDDDNIWVVDAGVEEGVKGNQIFKFNQQGDVLIELGQPGIRGDGPNLFNEPSDLAIGPNGDLYIADGHINPESNRRIVHMTSEGEFIEAWGSRGTGPLQFDCPHSLAIDSMGRIFVGDRTNNRIQILSPEGELLGVWEHFGRPSGVRIHDDMLYVVDSESRAVEGQYGYNPGYHRGIRIGSVIDGIITEFIPDPAPHDSTSFPEGISVDDAGVIWGASVGDRKVTKFVKQ